MGRKKRQSPFMHKQDEWKEQYESGMSFTQIGKLSGVHYTTVQNVLKDVVQSRPKQTYAHLSSEWVQLYVVDGYSINSIAEQYKVDANTVSKYLKKEAVTLRRTSGQSSPYKKYIKQWISDYKSGKSLKQIADEYHIFPQTIHKHIKDKVQMREYAETSQVYAIQHPDYLESIDSREKAYWLGVWYGTGFLHKYVGGYESTLIVGIKDRVVLERFKEKIGYEKPLEEVEENNSHVIKLRIHNKKFYESLVKQGLEADKVRTMKMPLYLPKEWYNSFILGFYEGKGACYTSNYEKNGVIYGKVTFQLFGNEAFLASLKSVIYEHTDIKTSLSVIKQKNKEDVHCLQTSSKENVKAIADWLYSGYVPYLEHRQINEILKRI